MRIGIICYPTYGGSGVVASELAAQLAARGHQIHIISSATPFRFTSLPQSDNIYLHEVAQETYPLFTSDLFSLSLACKIRQVAIDERLDLIHAHYAIPHAASAWMASEMLTEETGRRLPFVTTLHGTDITLVGRSPSFASVVRFTLQKADAVTTVSEWLRRETIDYFDPGRDIRTIHNFIDPERFRPRQNSDCKKRFAPGGEKLIVHLSNFRPVKRVPDVVRIFAGIAREMPAKLLLVGDGPDHELAMAEARKLGVLDRTWFLGKQDNVERYLGIADLFLFPSDHESFGLAALEAMSSEVPTVASSGGGLPEVIEDGVTGFIRPVGDIAAMTAAGLSVLRDPAYARRIGVAARRSVLERFKPERIVDQYENLYLDVLGVPASERGVRDSAVPDRDSERAVGATILEVS